MTYRPSWVVLSPAPLAMVRKVARRALFVEGTKGMVAAYEPELGAQGPEREVACTLSRSVAGSVDDRGSRGPSGLHYAIMLANVADDPDHGFDRIVAYQDGNALGTLKVRPADLVAHFGLAVPALEEARRKLRPADFALTPMLPKAKRGEAKFFHFTVAQWEHTFATETDGDVSYLVDGAERSSYEPVLKLLASKDASKRFVAARLMYFAEPDADWRVRLEAALATEKDERATGALRKTLAGWSK